MMKAAAASPALVLRRRAPPRRVRRLRRFRAPSCGGAPRVTHGATGGSQNSCSHRRVAAAERGGTGCTKSAVGRDAQQASLARARRFLSPPPARVIRAGIVVRALCFALCSAPLSHVAPRHARRTAASTGRRRAAQATSTAHAPLLDAVAAARRRRRARAQRLLLAGRRRRRSGRGGGHELLPLVHQRAAGVGNGLKLRPQRVAGEGLGQLAKGAADARALEHLEVNRQACS